MKLAIPLLAALWLGAAAALAQPATITAKAPQAMAKAMQNLGYRAELTINSDGAPLIHSAASGLQFGVYFFGCEAGANCTTVQFYMWLELEQQVNLSVLNEWNRTKRFGTAVRGADGQPYLKMDLNLDFGGITIPAFEDNLALWERLMADFSNKLGFNSDAPPKETAPKQGPLQEL